MEQAKERLKVDIDLLEKALQTLVQALKEPLTDLVRDAGIQRFEYVFELSWKTIRIAARYMGSICNSPREAIKYAFKMGWIQKPDLWLETMEERNKTSHTYNEAIAEEVYEAVKNFPGLVQELITSLRAV